MKKFMAVVWAILLFGFVANAAIDAKKGEERFLLTRNTPVRISVETDWQRDGLVPVRISDTSDAAVNDISAISDDVYEDNDTLATAATLTPGVYAGLVLLDDDYFKVYVQAGKDLKVSISGAGFPPTDYDDMDILLYDVSGNLLAGAISSQTNETLCLSNVAAGWYIIRNQFWGAPMGYTLTIASGDLPLGEISGRVSDVRGNGIAHIWVMLNDPSGDWNLLRGFVPTDSAGNYRFAYTGGDHRVWFDANIYNNQDIVGSYVNEWYNDVATVGAAQTLTIQVGQTLPGINAVLADAGMITGRVTGPDSQPLSYAVVHVTDDSGTVLSSTRTLPDGTYRLHGIPTSGNYHVRFRTDGGYAVQWYNNKSWFGAADAVPVIIRYETPDINAQLGDGGTISGQVTDADSGQSIANVTVSAFDEANWSIFNGVTDADGKYTLSRFPTCGVKLFFNAGTTGYISQWYSDKANFAAADVVPATAGQSVTGIDAQLEVQTLDFIGTWDGQGVYYRNSETGAWVKLATPATLITAGDLDGDGIDDLIGIWPGQGGVWVKYSKTGSWAKLSTTARDIASGDMNGDGRVDLLATWDGQGVYYRNSIGGAWVKLATPATLVTAGDLDGDGKDDLIGIWPGQGGIWVKYSDTGSWAKLSSTARDIAAGDMNGDGREDLVGTYDGQGVYYRNSIGGAWVKLATPATLVAAGELDGDGRDDLIGIWPGQGGVWVKYSDTGSWAKLSSTARHIAAGLMRGAAGAAEVLAEPSGGFAEGPGNFGYQDLSEAGPGGLRFLCREEENLVPLEDQESALRRMPGPDEYGFQCLEQDNLIPGSGTTTKPESKKKREQP
jgi:hypothetical protein